jgi:hypothetical protein
MTSPKTSYMKYVTNELNFLLVTHMTCFDTRLGLCGFLKSGFSTRQILDNLGIQMLGQDFGPQDE